MFGKLLKYDFKALFKAHIGMYIFVLITGLTVMFSNILEKINPGNIFSMFFGELLMGLFVLSAVAIVVISFVVCILRYRKNVLKDEGYLTHTLPVMSWQIHVSKILMSALYMYITVVVIYLISSLAQLDITWGVDVCKMLNAEMTAQGMDLFLVFMGIILAVYPFLMYSYIFACLCMGYRMSGNKDLMSFVAYLIFNVINQVLSFILIVIAGFSQFGNIFTADIYTMEMTEAPVEFMNIIMAGSLILNIVMIVIYNALSVRTLDKKLNLE
ncbi:MAG: hypothetical protein Q4F06_07190 [Eubacteriales bacterium]|nr:hypothetical protein [Eubacteriales bacterium]